MYRTINWKLIPLPITLKCPITIDSTHANCEHSICHYCNQMISKSYFGFWYHCRSGLSSCNVLKAIPIDVQTP